MTLNFLFLIPLGIIGVACSYTDVKYGKIPNKLIGFGFAYALLLFLSLFSYDRLLFQNPENIRYILESILNGAIAFVVGYALWYFKLWSAGDGKLFALYALLLPLGFYSEVFVSYFPSFNLLVNLFFPLLMVLMAGAAFTAFKERERIMKNIRKEENWTPNNIKKGFIGLGKMLLDYVFIIIIIQFLFRFGGKLMGANIDFNPFLVYFLLLLIMRHFSRFRSRSKKIELGVYSVIIGYCIFLIANGNSDSLISIIKIAFTFMIMIGLTRYVLDLYIKEKEIRQVAVKNLKKGMIPSHDFSRFLMEKLEIYKDGEEKQSFQWVDAAGFDEYQTKTIKDLFADDQDYKIEIYKTFPFAPFLLLSAAISVYTQSSFLIFLDNIFRYIVN